MGDYFAVWLLRKLGYFSIEEVLLIVWVFIERERGSGKVWERLEDLSGVWMREIFLKSAYLEISWKRISDVFYLIFGPVF